ncbi:MAG: serine protease [Acidobacteriia bacterium]|nr:serine protease [Terriglobia bacterium]
MRKLIVGFMLAICSTAFGQDTPKPPPPQPQKPIMAQLKETVIVIKLECQDGPTPYPASGTGFFVQIGDWKQGTAFTYLVTNRHVAECWDHRQRPMEVKSVSIRINLLDGSSTTVALNERGNAPWVLPSSESVDLAVLPLGLKTDKAEWLTIPTSLFATDDMFSSGRIHEGQRIVFTGFFPKIEGVKKAQPIVREGIISSLADEPLILLKKDVAAKFYLGDVHVLAGNSGSPVMVNLGGIQGSSLTLGEDYRLIGVVSGYLTEDENMSLKLETTVEATASANSGITTIVPVADLMALLNDERLLKQRAGKVP